jgi:hypothetical protein
MGYQRRPALVCPETANPGQVANVFSRRPSQNTAAKFHTARNQAFTTWAEVTGVAMAA